MSLGPAIESGAPGWTKIFPAGTRIERAGLGMGYLARRIVGYIVFLSVLGALSSLAVDVNSASGGTALSGRNGAIAGVSILFTALIASWIVRWTMRRRTKLRRAHLR
jgi:hypothetical protein